MKPLHDELDSVLDWLQAGNMGTDDILVSVPVYEIQGRSNFAGYVDYHWVKMTDHNCTNFDAGPKETCRKIFKYTGDKMMYIVWLSAVIKTIEDSDRRPRKDWCGEPYRFLTGLRLAIHERYPGEFEYHTACTNVFPEDMRIGMFKPAIEPYQMSHIVSNMATYTRLMWAPTKFVFDK